MRSPTARTGPAALCRRDWPVRQAMDAPSQGRATGHYCLQRAAVEMSAGPYADFSPYGLVDTCQASSKLPHITVSVRLRPASSKHFYICPGPWPLTADRGLSQDPQDAMPRPHPPRRMTRQSTGHSTRISHPPGQRDLHSARLRRRVSPPIAQASPPQPYKYPTAARRDRLIRSPPAVSPHLSPIPLRLQHTNLSDRHGDSTAPTSPPTTRPSDR